MPHYHERHTRDDAAANMPLMMPRLRHYARRYDVAVAR